MNVPGDDTYEVGLSPLRSSSAGEGNAGGAQVLMACKPDTVDFCGKFIENGEERINTLQLTERSAGEWAQRMGKERTV